MRKTAFDGRVTFVTRHNSLGLNVKSLALEEGFKAYNPALHEQYTALLSTFSVVLAVTEHIEFAFQGDENDMLVEFRDFWNAYQNADDALQAQLAVDWQMSTFRDIYNEWLSAANDAQLPFRNPATLPYDSLTSAEKEEAANSDSPLVERGKRRGKTSASLPVAS